MVTIILAKADSFDFFLLAPAKARGILNESYLLTFLNLDQF